MEEKADGRGQGGWKRRLMEEDRVDGRGQGGW
jgi:hypothetical protein